MIFLNIVKSCAISLADAVNKVFEPYEEFTRPLDTPQNNPSLDEKASLFDKQLKTGFLVRSDESSVIWDYKKQIPDGYDLGDQALWHGVTTFMLGLKYKLSQTQEDLEWFRKSATGLLAHQINGRLIRGIDPYGKTADDASNDSMTGHVLGIYGAMKFGCKEIGDNAAIALASNLLTNKDKMTKADGSPTTYGRLVAGALTDPLNLLVALTVYKLGEMAGLETAGQRYAQLVHKYKELLAFGHVSLLHVRKDYDEHRAAICHSILADLEANRDLQLAYINGLRRDWKRCRKSRNPWIYYLVNRIINYSPLDAKGCIQRLEELSYEEKRDVKAVINSNKPYPGVKYVKFGKKLVSTQPLPLWRIPSQDFFWQRSQYTVDGMLNMIPNSIEHNGVDFLVCYYGFKDLRLIK